MSSQREDKARFVLWPTKPNPDKPKAPTVKGYATCCHCGQDMELAGWPRKDDKAGVSGLVERKREPDREPF